LHSSATTVRIAGRGLAAPSSAAALRLVRGQWPLAAAVFLLWATLAIVVSLSVRQNLGHLVYDVDDPYIHMAIAKHFVQAGTWGVTPYEFSSSSSSILWPLLLAAIYRIFGVSEVSPLLINVVVSTAVLVVAYRILVRLRPGLPPAYVLLGLVALIYLSPLPALVASGHEHAFHLGTTLAFAYVAALELSADRPSRGRAGALAVLALSVTLARYEGLFVVFPTCVLLLLRRRVMPAVAIGAAALLPLGAYAAISLLHGWFWLPNSVLLKGRVQTVDHLGSLLASTAIGVYRDFLQSPHLLLLTLLALLLYGVRFDPRSRGWRPDLLLLVLFAATSVLHLLLAGRVRWFYRHDAYLTAFGLVAVAVPLYQALLPARRLRVRSGRVAQYLALAAVVAFLGLPVVKRGLSALQQRGGSVLQVAQATTNIYQQQYQMGLFLSRYYTGRTVALNDIGATNFLADIHVLDLIGLGSLDVARLRLAGQFDAEHLETLAKDRGASIAIVYDTWFGDENGSLIPASWQRVGQWTISRNVVAGADTVSFYAVDPAEVDRLTEHLREFAPHLPPGVQQGVGNVPSPR
jgi:hypothetical protein